MFDKIGLKLYIMYSIYNAKHKNDKPCAAINVSSDL